LSQQNGLVESLRVELDTATEAKNEMENRHDDSLKEIETLKKEFDNVKKYCDVMYQFILNFSVILCFNEIRIAELLPIALFSYVGIYCKKLKCMRTKSVL